MTHEIGSWSGHDTQPQPFNTDILEDDPEKPFHLISDSIDRMLDLAMDERRGLRQVRASIGEFDRSTLLEPGRHLMGHMREARFDDALFLRKTVAKRIGFVVETLIVFTDSGRPHELHVATARAGGIPGGMPRSYVGVEAMADSPIALHDMGKLEATFEDEYKDRWPGALTLGDLNARL